MKKFQPKPGQTDFTNIRYAPVKENSLKIVKICEKTVYFHGFVDKNVNYTYT